MQQETVTVEDLLISWILPDLITEATQEMKRIQEDRGLAWSYNEGNIDLEC